MLHSAIFSNLQRKNRTWILDLLLFLHLQSDSSMRVIVTILFFFLASLNGCVSHSVSMDNERSRTENIVLVDDVEADLMNLYNAAADTRNALQQETPVCLSGFSVRVLPSRTRTVSNISTRQVLLSTHKPVVSRLIHHSIIQLVAFPKEYHVFRLRRILI